MHAAPSDLPAGNLWYALLERYQRACAIGALRPIETEHGIQ